MVQLVEIVHAVRHFMPGIWRAWHEDYDRPIPAVLSAGTCGRTSLLLQHILRAEGFDAEWSTGAAAENCGFFDGRVWQSHSWVVCDSMIIDITADQYAAHPVVIVPDGDLRYRRSSRDPADPEWQARRRKAVLAAFDLWQGLARG